MSKISIKTNFVDGDTLPASDLNNNFMVIEAGINANEENLQEVIDQAITELDAELEAITANRGWDWNGGNRVTFYKGDTDAIEARDIINGQLLYNTETGETALDDNNNRIVTGSGNVISVSNSAPANPATKEWIKPITINGTDTAEEYFRDSNNSWKKILTEPSGDTLPIGAITQFSGETAPTNWLLCNGQAISRTDYAELFGVIGTTYGTGDGSTTFNLPDLRGRVPVGLKSSDASFDALGETGGEKNHTLTVNEMASHGHSLTPNNNIYAYNYGGTAETAVPTASDVGKSEGRYYQTISAGSTGGDQPHNNLQPYIVTNYIIKAKQSIGVVGTVTNDITDTNTDAVPTCATVKDYVDAANTYSTTEHIVGKWYNDKPIYSKTLILTNVAPGTTSIQHGISNLDDITKTPECAFKRSTYLWEFAPSIGVQGTYNIEIYDLMTNNFKLYVGSGLTDVTKLFITLYYTKTTD